MLFLLFWQQYLKWITRLSYCYSGIPHKFNYNSKIPLKVVSLVMTQIEVMNVSHEILKESCGNVLTKEMTK